VTGGQNGPGIRKYSTQKKEIREYSFWLPSRVLAVKGGRKRERGTGTGETGNKEELEKTTKKSSLSFNNSERQARKKGKEKGELRTS